VLIPVRCFSCNKPVSEKWEEFQERVSKGEEAGKILDELGFERLCCRRMFLSNVDLIDEVKAYKRY